MKKTILFLLIFCIGWLPVHASELNTDSFLIKTIRNKDGKYEGISIYDRSGALKHELIAPVFECAQAPLLLGGFEDDGASFVYLCDFGYNPEVFYYAEGEFFSDEIVFGSADGMMQTDNYLVIFSYPALRIYEKETKKFIQKIELEGFTKSYYINEQDFNADGLDDILLDGNSDSYYLIFDPKKKEFFLSELCYQSDSNWGDHIEYKCGGGFYDIFYYTSVGLKNNFEIRIALFETEDDRLEGRVKYYGQRDSIKVKVKEIETNRLVLEEVIGGANGGVYILNDLSGKNSEPSLYIRKDGKKFNLSRLYADRERDGEP